MKTLVTILALQLFVGASAFAVLPGEESESGLQKASVAIAQSNFNVNPADEEQDARNRADELLGGSGSGGGSARTRVVEAPKVRPTGNEWADKGAANK